MRGEQVGYEGAEQWWNDDAERRGSGGDNQKLGEEVAEDVVPNEDRRSDMQVFSRIQQIIARHV